MIGNWRFEMNGAGTRRDTEYHKTTGEEKTIHDELVGAESDLFFELLNRCELINLDRITYLEKITAHQKSIDSIVKCLFRRRNDLDLGELCSNIV